MPFDGVARKYEIDPQQTWYAQPPQRTGARLPRPEPTHPGFAEYEAQDSREHRPTPLWVYIAVPLVLLGLFAVGLVIGVGGGSQSRQAMLEDLRHAEFLRNCVGWICGDSRTPAGWRSPYFSEGGNGVPLRVSHWARLNASPAKVAHLSGQRSGRIRGLHPPQTAVLCTGGVCTTSTSGNIAWTSVGTAATTITLPANAVFSGVIPVYYGGTAPDPTPQGAAYHAVTDTYFDADVHVLKRETRAHVVNPAYCHPGYSPQDQQGRMAAMPRSVRELVAQDAADDPVMTVAR